MQCTYVNTPKNNSESNPLLNPRGCGSPVHSWKKKKEKVNLVTHKTTRPSSFHGTLSCVQQKSLIYDHHDHDQEEIIFKPMHFSMFCSSWLETNSAKCVKTDVQLCMCTYGDLVDVKCKVNAPLLTK